MITCLVATQVIHLAFKQIMVKEFMQHSLAYLIKEKIGDNIGLILIHISAHIKGSITTDTVFIKFSDTCSLFKMTLIWRV